MTRTLTTIALALILNTQLLMLNSSAAVPLSWTVETTRATPAVFEAYQGETIEFSARLQNAGKPLAAPSECSFYWQTNGMGSAYWSAPASATSNLLSATWSPEMDVGARVYNCFIGSPSNNYHAAFQLRLRPSPGATPNALPLPTPVIDFAKVTVLNPPWPSGIDTNVVREIVNAEIVPATNVLYKSLSDSIDGRLEPVSNLAASASAAATMAASEADAAQSAANAADAKADAAQTAADSAAAKANSALVYSSATYQYMAGNTNAWFEGTNYPDRVTAANKVKFAFEPGMDLISMPCSMALKEIRDSEKQDVWDQRDWTVWYWNFKASQMSNHFNHVVHALAEEVRTNCMTRGWAKYTAVQGLDNPAADTLWIDTPKVTLAAGHQWEKLVEVGGAGYWTLTGNGVELAPEEAESSFLTVKDFEGNACLTFRKTSSYLVYCEAGTDISRSFYDAHGRVVFHLTTSAQPTAEFSIFCNGDDFVEQGEEGCPANYEWTGSAGNWDCHFKLKDGIDSNACFARFKILVEGENVIEHTIPIKLSGGIVFEQDGRTYKIKPSVSGSTVTWSVVQ